METLTGRPVLGNVGNIRRNINLVKKFKDPLNQRANGRCLRSQTILAEAQKAAAVIVTRSTSMVEDIVPFSKHEPTAKSNPPEVLDDIMELDETDVPEPMQVDSLQDKIKQIDSGNCIYACQEYASDIFEYLKTIELKFVVPDDVFKSQKFVTARMRGILVDWLIQVHFRFHLLIETLYLTVSILDRYLQKQSVNKDDLQLVGITAMLIATKFEETYCPRIKDLVYISDGAYVKQQIVDMEMKILNVLNYQISTPLPIHFLRRISKIAACDCREHTTSKYIMELTLTDHSFSSWPPSLLAAASSYLSLRLNRENSFSWDEVFVHYSQYREEDLVPFVRKISKKLVMTKISTTKTITVKYGSARFFKVSSLPQLSSALVFRLAK